MDYKKAIEYLYSFQESDIELGLERIESLLEELGNPHKDLKVIHVAGTNGKGSVCAMVDFILQEAGLNVGRYTSPHLVDFGERIMINNEKISNSDLAEYLSRVKPLVDKQTFFEIVTALAFLYFKEKKVDYVVCEVGLGGRFDATNVVTPLVSAITNISIEHTHYLGSTVEKIAFEKAGIIKQNISTVTTAKHKGLRVIKDIAESRNSELKIVNKTYEGPMNLKGNFQRKNAALAIAAVKKIGIKITPGKIESALQKVIWPGRFQLDGNLLYDCAHNPAAFRALIEDIKKLKYKKIILVIGILKDKKIDEIIGIISPLADEIIITKPKIGRAQDPEEIAKFLDKKYVIVNDVNQAIEKAESIAGEEDLIVVTGSIYLVGEALS